MFVRYLLVLCIVTFFVFQIYAEDDAELDDRSAKGKAVAKILGKIAAGLAANCVLEAGEKCAHLWKKPEEALNCGKKFFKENKGKCAIGG